MDLKNRTELAHIFLLTGLLFGIAAAIYHSYLFGGSVYIFRDVGSDTFNQYWPDIESFFRKIHGGELHAWLFSMGLGNALPVILHYVADPFTLLLVFFPDGTLAFGLIWVAVLKELAAGILMYLFCREIGLRRSSSMLAGILWAFSGYMVLWGQHYFMATALPCYAMVMLGLVLYRHRRSGKLMMLGLWLAAVNSVYTAAWIVIGFLITILVLYLLEEKKSFRRFWIYLWGYFWRGLTAAGLSAVVWLPSILEMLRSSRYQEQGKMGIDFFWSGSDLLDIILRGFSNNSLGINASNALGYNYYEQIMWAASILGIVFVFHNMIVRKGKERLLCIVTGALALISLVSRIPAYLLNFGKYVTYRWSYLIVFVIILNTVYAAEDILKNRKTRRKLLIFDFSFGAALLIVSFQVLFHFYTSEMEAEDLAVSIFVYRGCIVFLLIYFLLFFLVTFLQSEKGVLAAKMMLTCFVCMEAVVLNYPTLNVNRVPVPKAGAYTMDYYSPGNREAIRWVKEFDQDLYRMERTMICGGNDPLIMDYHGTFSYGMHGKEIDEFYERNSLNDPNGDFTSRIAGNETLESLLG